MPAPKWLCWLRGLHTIRPMNGLMMDYPLTLSTIFRRAETLFPRARRSSGAPPTSRSTATPTPTSPTARAAPRAALADLGLAPGDRVATLGWNHGPHLEAYFGIPLMGGVLHTLNLRLHPDELAYIVNHADDRAVLVDESLLPLWEQVKSEGRRPDRDRRRRHEAGAPRRLLSTTTR